MPDQSSPALLDASAAGVLARLTAGDLSACLVTASCSGECDVRIEIRCPDSAVTAELLCRCPDHPASWWYGVRDDRGERVVWRGPDIHCHPARVVRFVEDLLGRPPEELRQRYTLLG
jgi:hypothetical protein